MAVGGADVLKIDVLIEGLESDCFDVSCLWSRFCLLLVIVCSEIVLPPTSVPIDDVCDGEMLLVSSEEGDSGLLFVCLFEWFPNHCSSALAVESMMVGWAVIPSRKGLILLDHSGEVLLWDQGGVYTSARPPPGGGVLIDR